MTEEDRDKLLAHVNAKWKVKLCALCHDNNWIFNGPFHVPLNLPGARVYETMPVIGVVCKNCGNTILISAIIAGLFVPGTAPTSAPETVR